MVDARLVLTAMLLAGLDLEYMYALKMCLDPCAPAATARRLTTHPVCRSRPHEPGGGADVWMGRRRDCDDVSNRCLSLPVFACAGSQCIRVLSTP